jgi:hypothetical protein
MNRRELLITGSAALGMAHVPGLAHADSLPRGKASGFRCVPAPGSPFSSGVVAMEGYTFLRIRLSSALPLADGLAAASREMKTLGCPPNALAGLELRAPQRMTRPGFVEFNQRYLTLLKQAGFPIGDTVSIARSDMVPRFDPPEVDSLFAFTFAVQQKFSAASNSDPDFLTSGTPEVASNPNRAIRERPDISLYQPDKRHPTLLGSYLAAATVYAAIYQRSPEDSSYTAGIDPELARYLRKTAWIIAQEYYGARK